MEATFTEQYIKDVLDPHHEDFTPEFQEMYREIEKEITDWGMEGNRKTAGWLTRRIIMIIHNKMNDV